MIAAFLYARVSTREQEREGYSIPAQRKLLAEYARTRGFLITREFIDIESAKNPGRKEFSNMLHLLETDGTCLTVLVEKTDRLYRNRTDALAFEALIEKRRVEIHLVKEGRVIGKESRSQDKFMHDIHVAVAKNYVENLREEVRKGMRQKAEEGVYPGRAPIGYRNNSVTRSIDTDPERAPIVQRIFELYASGEYSLITLRETVLNTLGLRLSRAYFEKLLKNRFYLGYFIWQGVQYKGTHEPLVSANYSSVSKLCSQDGINRNTESTSLRLLACSAALMTVVRLRQNYKRGNMFIIGALMGVASVRCPTCASKISRIVWANC